jgi:hypothetical protein
LCCALLRIQEENASELQGMQKKEAKKKATALVIGKFLLNDGHTETLD